MISSDYIFFLGAKDPEMDRIAEILAAQNGKYYWTTKNGRPVHTESAYRADKPDFDVSDKIVVFIECTIPGLKSRKTILIDHHNPGDPGYNLGAKEYWAAISLGQLHALFNLQPQLHTDFVLAAMDHCFNAAVRGECPGVSPEEVMALRIKELAKSTNTAIEDVNRKIAAYVDKMSGFPTEKIADEPVTHIPYTGTGYTLDYLCAQVAAVQTGTPILIHLRNEENGPERIHLCGNVSKSTVEYFLDTYAPSRSLANIYGSPQRGYAGAYLRL